eukprot:TRINITY_DN8986_c0_g1_i1.p1 TRINITY_DN8986_c0_g1~~TRINITY_DN8986_c0_g1_i1.p1  ORF type:complete len:396 (+),score=70.85 TRINITY_DN8986_c0_g1_i1:90-1277(+)
MNIIIFSLCLLFFTSMSCGQWIQPLADSHHSNSVRKDSTGASWFAHTMDSPDDIQEIILNGGYLVARTSQYFPKYYVFPKDIEISNFTPTVRVDALSNWTNIVGGPHAFITGLSPSRAGAPYVMWVDDSPYTDLKRSFDSRIWSVLYHDLSDSVLIAMGENKQVAHDYLISLKSQSFEENWRVENISFSSVKIDKSGILHSLSKRMDSILSIDVSTGRVIGTVTLERLTLGWVLDHQLLVSNAGPKNFYLHYEDRGSYYISAVSNPDGSIPWAKSVELDGPIAYFGLGNNGKFLTYLEAEGKRRIVVIDARTGYKYRSFASGDLGYSSIAGIDQNNNIIGVREEGIDILSLDNGRLIHQYKLWTPNPTCVIDNNAIYCCEATEIFSCYKVVLDKH